MTRLRPTLAAGVAMLFLALVALPTGAAARTGCATPPNLRAAISGIAQGVNRLRAGQGLSSLRTHDRLNSAAQAHACDLARSGRFDHRGTTGTNAMQRAVRAGYGRCMTGENLAWGYPQVTRIVSGWHASSGHRRIMLDRQFDEMGVGVEVGPNGPVWVMVAAQAC